MLLTRAENWFPGLRLCFFLTYLGHISTTHLTLVSQLKVTITRSSLLHKLDSSPIFPVHNPKLGNSSEKSKGGKGRIQHVTVWEKCFAIQWIISGSWSQQRLSESSEGPAFEHRKKCSLYYITHCNYHGPASLSSNGYRRLFSFRNVVQWTVAFVEGRHSVRRELNSKSKARVEGFVLNKAQSQFYPSYKPLTVRISM